MGSLGVFLRGLLDEGRVVLPGKPVLAEGDRAEALSVLEPVFADFRLDVAGPLIAFDPSAALVASEMVRQACWFLVNRSESVEEMERWLIPPTLPRSASEHLSADLVFRFLPQIYRRARSIAPEDRMAAILADLFRAWPLSGVLSDLEDGPTDLESLGTHPGLLMLYAERLAHNEKAEWFPQGIAMDYVDLIYDGLGKTRPIRRRELEGVALGG